MFLGVFCGIFYFLNLEINKKSLATEEISVKWLEESGKREEIRSLARGIKLVEKESLELEKHFAKNSDLVPFLDTIESLGVKLGGNIETTSVEITPDNLNLIVGLKITGSFDSIYKFLNLLENAPYVLQITDMNMERENLQTTTLTPIWVANVNLKLLSFLP